MSRLSNEAIKHLLSNQGKENLRRVFVEYEVASNPITQFIPFAWMQYLIAKYYTWKVDRKADRYFAYLEDKVERKDEYQTTARRIHKESYFNNEQT